MASTAVEDSDRVRIRQRNTIISEIVIRSERKYMHDLETLQQYAETLAAFLPSKLTRGLFHNLKQILDLHRGVLYLFESISRLKWEDQRWGILWSDQEMDFSVYTTYCSNCSAAIKLALSLQSELSPFNNLINAQTELPAFIIKPVSRLSHYPVILQALIDRTSPEDYPWYDELSDAIYTSKRIVALTHEKYRCAETAQVVESLRDRVDDWKGHDVAKFGHLILQDVFLIQKGGIDREYHVFLFENILVCGRHIPTINRKPFKISSLFKKRSQDGGSPAIEDPPLQLKGRIFMSSIISVVPTRACADVYSLEVRWRGDTEMEFFNLHCHSEEQMLEWEAAITRLVAVFVERRPEGGTILGLDYS